MPSRRIIPHLLHRGVLVGACEEGPHGLWWYRPSVADLQAAEGWYPSYAAILETIDTLWGPARCAAYDAEIALREAARQAEWNQAQQLAAAETWYGPRSDQARSGKETARLIAAALRQAVREGQLPQDTYRVTCRAYHHGSDIDTITVRMSLPRSRELAARLLAVVQRYNFYHCAPEDCTLDGPCGYSQRGFHVKLRFAGDELPEEYRDPERPEYWEEQLRLYQAEARHDAETSQ